MEIFNLGGGIYPKCSFLDGLAFCGVKVTNVFILVKKTIVGFKKGLNGEVCVFLVVTETYAIIIMQTLVPPHP